MTAPGAAGDEGQAWLASCSQRFLDAAEAQLPAPGWPLHDAMRYGVLGEGKRLRPALVYGVAEALGKAATHAALADRVALAVELVHCYSLIHDDLPAMDDAATRRSQPSCHRKFGEDIAILAGDALQPLAFAQIVAPQVPAQAGLAMVRELSDACGDAGIIRGQALDLLPTAGAFDGQQIQDMHALKTTRLMLCAARLACLGLELRAGDPRFAALEGYARGLGTVFQIRDDWLDRREDEAASRPNLVVCLGAEAAQACADKARRAAVASLEGAGLAASRLPWLLEYCAVRAK